MVYPHVGLKRLFFFLCVPIVRELEGVKVDNDTKCRLVEFYSQGHVDKYQGERSGSVNKQLIDFRCVYKHLSSLATSAFLSYYSCRAMSTAARFQMSNAKPWYIPLRHDEPQQMPER